MEVMITAMYARTIARMAQIWLPIAAILSISVVVFGVRDAFNSFWLFTLACWAALDCYWAIGAGDEGMSSPGKRSISTAILAWTPYALYCLPLSSVPILGQRFVPNFVALQFAGATICALGVGFSIWARRTLANNWNATVMRDDHQALVQHGPYAVVRHPIYMGFLAAMFGMFLVLGEVRAAIFAAGGLDVLMKKMKREDEILLAAFPNEYPPYQQRVARLFPWIW